MKTIYALLGAVSIVILSGVAYGHFGIFNVAADDPHWPATTRLLEWGRERSINARAADLEVPNLDDPDLLISGGPDYNEMCSGCHSKPGSQDAELAQGLYPHPPNFAEPGNQGHGSGDRNSDAARKFWIIKHGLKMTGMPAWGATHDDARMWAMVAFLQKMPTLSSAEYQILTARSEGASAHAHGEASNEAEHGEEAEHMSHEGDEKEPTITAVYPEAAVQAFHAAMKYGNAQAATSLLSPELQVYEGGHAERSRDEYVKAHMPGDMTFMKDAKVTILKSRTKTVGDAAWVLTESRIQGDSSAGKPFDVLSTETALLRRKNGQWLIDHFHWSSSPYQDKP